MFCFLRFAQYGTSQIQTVDQLIEAADNGMYQMKIKKRAQAKEKARL